LTVPDLVAFSAVEVNHSNDWQRQLIKLMLIWLTWLFLIAATARPQWIGGSGHIAHLRSRLDARSGHLWQHGNQGHAS
jgi:hypothetical protein